MPDDGISTLVQAGHRMIYHGEKFQTYFLVRRQHIGDATWRRFLSEHRQFLKLVTVPQKLKLL